jgi:hypothetical protein
MVSGLNNPQNRSLAMPTLMRYAQIALLALMAHQSLPAQNDAAPPSASSYKLRGELREYGKYFVDDPRTPDILQTRLKLELLSGVGGNFAFRAVNFLNYDAVNKDLNWDLKEGYSGFYSTYFDASFGKQIISWGKAQDINPTDVVNPQDFSDLLEEKPLRKKGLFLLKGDAKLVSLVLEGVLKPDFDSATIPALGSRWGFPTSPVGLTNLPSPEMPKMTLGNLERALKLSWAGPFLDASLSYFDGWDQQPTTRYTTNPLTGIPAVSARSFNRTRMFGADVSSTLGDADVWGEAAYFRTADPNGTDAFIKNPYFQYIVGANYPLPGDIKFTLQYFQEVITKTGNAAGQKTEEAISSKLGIGLPLEQTLILNLDRSFGNNEACRAQMVIIYDIKENGFFCNPKLVATLAAPVTCELGAALFSGDKGFFFGNFRENNEAYLKCLYAF